MGAATGDKGNRFIFNSFIYLLSSFLTRLNAPCRQRFLSLYFVLGSMTIFADAERLRNFKVLYRCYIFRCIRLFFA